jgi:lysophospholipase L1-like esterase
LLALLQADEALRNRLKTANIVSVSIGGNDFLQTIRAFPNSDDEELKLRMQILHGSIEEIHTLLKQLNPDATIMLIGLYNPYPSGHDLHELGTEYTPKYNEMLEKFTTGTTMVINPYDVFNTRESELTHINEGDIHPTNQGYNEIVDLMKKTYSD